VLSEALIDSLTSRPTGVLLDVAENLGGLKKSLGDVSHAIRAAEKSRSLTEPPASILRSIVHMQYNRIWGVDHEREVQLLRLFRRTREQITLSRNKNARAVLD
jgi:hypothetical protein